MKISWARGSTRRGANPVADCLGQPWTARCTRPAWIRPA